MPQIRASDRFIAFLDEYRQKLKREDALDQLLDRFKYLEDTLTSKAQENAPECKRRLNYDGKDYCVQTSRKGLNRLKEIPAAEVCTICIEEHWNIPKETRTEQPKPKQTQQWTETDHKLRHEIAQDAMKRIKARSTRIDMGDSEGVEPDYMEGYR